MSVFTLRSLAIILVFCGIFSPSALSKKIPRAVDVANVLLRLVLIGAYSFTELWARASVTNHRGNTLAVNK